MQMSTDGSASHRIKSYKNKALDSLELRRRREEEGIQLRKQKRDEQVCKQILTTLQQPWPLFSMILFLDFPISKKCGSGDSCLALSILAYCNGDSWQWVSSTAWQRCKTINECCRPILKDLIQSIFKWQLARLTVCIHIYIYNIYRYLIFPLKYCFYCLVSLNQSKILGNTCFNWRKINAVTLKRM